MRRTTLVVAAVAAMTIPAFANCEDHDWPRSTYCKEHRAEEHNDHEWERRREREIERVREIRHTEERRNRDENEEWVDGWVRDRGEREASGYVCLPAVDREGPEHENKEAAQRAALLAWSDAVRYRHGEVFGDPVNWGYPHLRCVQSSSAFEMGAVRLGNRHRCQIVAKPCRPPLLPMDK